MFILAENRAPPLELCPSAAAHSPAASSLLQLLLWLLLIYYPTAKDLTSREVGKVRRHFQKRRDSGGGDCGQIEKTGGNTYKISFKEREAQERVLLRKFHTISLPSGELRLTVSQTDWHNNPDLPTTRQSQTSTKTNTKVLERIFPMDIFLLHFLRDNPKTFKVLQKQLSSIGCTVEFKLDKKEAVITGDIEKGSGGAFVSAAEKWEIKVDRIFTSLTKSYICYHVGELKKVKILLQDLSFVNDDIKVYIENGFAVIVGEREAVKGRIAILEKRLPVWKILPIVGKHFKLVEEEFSREMSAHCPGVKIQRDDAMITLEGPDDEVQSGATKLRELIGKVKEKKVKLSTPLLTFITSSSIISTLQARFQQSFTNPVFIDVESEVVLSSLSFDALEGAEAALQKDLSVASVKLQGAEAVPPDLNRVKEIMNKAKNEANCGELRVDVSFIPGLSGTEIRLVGYSEDVNKLKEVLNNYRMNQVWTHEVLNLPYPELVDCFDKFLNIMGVKQTKVTLKALHFPYPCVDVSGPRSLVQEVWASFSAILAALTSKRLSLNGLGAQWYFQAEGKVSKELVEQSCQVLISGKQDVYSPNLKTGLESIRGRTLTPILRWDSNLVGNTVLNKTKPEIKLHSMADKQVNMLEAPMLNRQLKSTKIVSVPQLFEPHVQQKQPLPSLSNDLSTLCATSMSQQSIFLFLGLSRKDVDDAMKKLKDLYQAQCSTQTIKKEELASLTQEDIKDLKQLVETKGLYMQMDQAGQGSLTVSGLKDGVNQVMQRINASMLGSLRREVRLREEEHLYIRVAWCILGHNSRWERLPKTASYNLENNDTAGGIVDAQGIQWRVNLQRLEATRRVTGERAKLKRLENLPDFTFPLYWDNMAADENLKKFELQPFSPEYQTMKEAFRLTVSKTVIKIERLQNVYLRRAYEVQKKHISDKNKQEGGAGEKLLYHGTTQENCDFIMKTGFNRSFAGQNATVYGHGTYFAVNASYSARPTYSRPAPDGSQFMFVARVLTGIYTLGQGHMKVPPPLSGHQPQDHFDSVVDALNNPSMYIVFHDHQAYPDYLITFK